MAVNREDVSPWINRVQVSSDDQSSLRLLQKLTAGTNITLNVLDAGGSEVIEINASGAASKLDDLSDVSITSPSGAEVLFYDSIDGQWENQLRPTGDLEDVSANASNAGEILIYNNTNVEYEPNTLTAGNAITITNADGSITIAVDESAIDHDALANFVANEHIDHSGVSISSGTGLSGGGDITSSRTLSLDETVLKDGGAKELDAADLAGGLGTDGQVLTSTGSGAQWEDASGGGASELSDLSDASVSTPSAGQTLLYHGTNSQYENAGITDGTGISKTTGDASLTLSLNEAVIKDGGAKEIDASELAGSSGTDGQVLTSTGSAAQWEDASGGGSAIILDLGDDGSNESTDLSEIATQHDRNSAYTEPSADKLLIEPFKVGAVEGYLEPGTLTIANNSTDSDHDIDVTGGVVGVHDFSGNWIAVEAPDETPAIQIDSTGEGGRINSSSLSANTWYEVATLYDAGNDTAGYGIYQDGDRPTATADLPGTFDHFRAMGTGGRSWWIRTDGSSNLRQFNDYPDSRFQFTFSERKSIGQLLNDTSASNGAGSHTFPSMIPPTECIVHINMHNNNPGSNDGLGISGEALNFSTDVNFADSIGFGGDNSDDDLREALTARNVTGQQIYWAGDTQQIIWHSVTLVETI